MEKKVLLKTKKLSKSFSNDGVKVQILKDLDLEIYEGDFTIIMGPSGAGKSTLLYALSGMDTPTSGKIEFEGEDIVKLNQDKLALFRRNNCGFVFQQIYLVESMSIMDNVLASGLLKKNNKKELVEKSYDLLKKVGIPKSYSNKYPTQISGGEAARVGIARALINNPHILFADEPTGALNSQTGKEVLDLFTEFNNEGQSIVMVTHDKNSARRGNRIIYIKDGEVAGICELGKYVPNDEARHKKLTEFLTTMGW